MKNSENKERFENVHSGSAKKDGKEAEEKKDKMTDAQYEKQLLTEEFLQWRSARQEGEALGILPSTNQELTSRPPRHRDCALNQCICGGMLDGGVCFPIGSG